MRQKGQGTGLSEDYETLRWPTNLDREAIVLRLVEMRELARTNGRTDFVTFFAEIEDMPPARIGSSVIAALSWIEGKPDYKAFSTQLSMVAMNLKNLK